MAIKWLDAKRLQGTNAERLAMTTAGSSPKTSWKELDRTTLGSDGTLTVSGFDAKDNLMILGHYKPVSGNVTSGLVLNSDTGDNYSNRRNLNSGTDVTVIDTDNKPCIQTDGAYGGSEFCYFVATVRNIASEEKLVITTLDGESDTGSGTAPNIIQSVGKWANTANQITTIQLTDADGDTAQEWASGSEVVVLGCDDDEADSGDSNFWQELSAKDLSGGTADNLSSGTITAKKYLWVEIFAEASGANTVANARFNSDGGGNYPTRQGINGGTTPLTARTEIELYQAAAMASGTTEFASMFIVNASATEKLVIGDVVKQNTAGAGTAPDRNNFVAKWTNTSSQITEIDFINNDTGSLGTSTSLRVWGSN